MAHHERTEILGELPFRWRCPDCGDTGDFRETFAVLAALRPQLDQLQRQMLDQGAVFVLPSDATPGLFGQCFGRDVYRMGGIKEPMIALPASQLIRLTGPIVTIGPAPVVDAATGKTVEPLADELAPFLDWPLYFPDDTVHCNHFPNCQNRFCKEPLSGQVYIASGRRMTVREFLADIKAHAEETASQQRSDG